MSTLELLCLYGTITQHGEINPALLFSMESTLDALITHILPYDAFWRTIMDTLSSRSQILDAFISICDGRISTSKCFLIVQHIAFNTLDWENAYKYGNDTFQIIYHLQKQKSDNCPPAVLKDVN